MCLCACGGIDIDFGLDLPVDFGLDLPENKPQQQHKDSDISYYTPDKYR